MGKLTDEEREGLTDEEIEALESDDESGGDGDPGAEDKKRVSDDKSKADDKDADGADKAKPEDKDKSGDKGADADEDKKGADADKKGAGADADKDKQGDDADAGGDDEDEPPMPADHPPILNLRAPTQEELDAERETLKGLKQKFDDGEISYEELAEQQRKLDRMETKAELAQEAGEASRDAYWKWEQRRFMDDYPALATRPNLNMSFTAEVNRLIATEEAARMTDRQLLEKAKENVEAEESETYGVKVEITRDGVVTAAGDAGKQPAGGKDNLRDAKKARADRGKVPTTLKDVPAADQGDEGAGKWKWLDDLADKDPEKYEAEINKLSESELAEYEAAT